MPFAPKEVSWGSLLVTSRFFHQRRSVNHVTFFNQRSSAEPQCRWNVLQKSKNDVSKILMCCFKYLWIVWFKFSSAFAIDVSGFAHSCHGVLNLDHRGQELSQLPGRWQPHTWGGFVVLFVKCNVFVAMYHRTTFCGFDTIQTFSTIDQQSQLSARGKKRDVENTPKFTRLTVSLPHDPASWIRPVGRHWQKIV